MFPLILLMLKKLKLFKFSKMPSYSKSATDAISSDLFEEVCRTYSKALWAEAYRILGDSASAQDIVQELFIELLLKNNLENIHKTTRGYLFTALRYKCYRVNRKRKIQRDRAENWFELQNWSEPESSALEQQETIRGIRRAIKSLPIQASKIIHAVFIEGKKRREVAQQMGLSINTVNCHIFSALKRLKREVITLQIGF